MQAESAPSSLPTNSDSKLVPVPVVFKLDRRIFPESTHNPSSESPIRQNPRGEGAQDRIAHIRGAATDVRDCQVVRQMSRAYQLNAIVEDKQPNRRRYEIISMNQCIGD